VFGRHLKLLNDSLAEVEKADAASRIGSRFGGSRNAVQVRLHQGEIVEILGKMTEDGETWYQIAPPAGEFRWIEATQVKRVGVLEAAERDAPATVVAASATEDAAAADATSASAPSAQRTEGTPPPDAEVKTQAGDAWRAAPNGASASSNPIAPPLASSNESPSYAGSPAAEATVPAAPPSAAAQTSAAPAVDPAAPLARQLTDLELRLSRMVAAPPDRWNTEQLERDTEALLAQAETAEDRDALKAMLAKLDKFGAIGRQHSEQSGRVEDGGNGRMEGDRVTPLPTPADSASGFDAVGILRPVVSKRPGAPQFALVDDGGQVISFVTPSPDVNLQPYLGHRIGIAGTRGYIPEFQRAHVTAGRVAPLSERLVR
jgi:hypothetical protein